MTCFRSFCIVATIAPYVMPITPSVSSAGANQREASGNR